MSLHAFLRIAVTSLVVAALSLTTLGASAQWRILPVPNPSWVVIPYDTPDGRIKELPRCWRV